MTHANLSRLAAPAALALIAVFAATTCDQPDDATVQVEQPDPLRARLRLSGFMQGRLEPCGCAAGQLGGLPRRAFFVRRDSEYDLLIEGGNVVAGGTALDTAKLETALTILTMPEVEYHALGLGPADLEQSLDDLATYLEVFPVKTVSSDLVAPEGTRWPIQPSLEQPAGRAVVRLASLTLAKPPGDAGKGFRLLTPPEAWKRAMEGVAPDTFRVLLVHGAPETCRAQATLQPRPDLIVGITDQVAEPLSQPEPVNGIPLVFTGTRGRMLVDVTLGRVQGEPRVTVYRVVPLPASETAKGALEDETAKQILLAHREQVKLMGLREQMAELRPTATGAEYVGSEACADCHEDSFDVWKKTKHAHAWKTLEDAEKGKKYGWPVTHYPDCVTCHVVGYGDKSGFVSPDKTAHLKDVGCEECHGPGSKHIEDDTVSMKSKGVDTCVACHDFEQSPDFADERKYDERWKAIEHFLDK